MHVHYVQSNTTGKNQKVETVQMSLKGGLDKASVVGPHNRILLSHEKKRHTDIAATWTNLETVMLSKRHQPWKTTYCMTAFL